jgi:hypothetical protein
MVYSAELIRTNLLIKSACCVMWFSLSSTLWMGTEKQQTMAGRVNLENPRKWETYLLIKTFDEC